MNAEPSGRLVLLLDHDPYHRLRLELLFKRAGVLVQIRNLAHPGELIDEMQADRRGPRPDLVLIDLDVPGLELEETVAAIRRLPRGRTTPVFLFRSSEVPDEPGVYWQERGPVTARLTGFQAILDVLRAPGGQEERDGDGEA